MAILFFKSTMEEIWGNKNQAASANCAVSDMICVTVTLGKLRRPLHWLQIMQIYPYTLSHLKNDRDVTQHVKG